MKSLLFALCLVLSGCFHYVGQDPPTPLAGQPDTYAFKLWTNAVPFEGLALEKVAPTIEQFRASNGYSKQTMLHWARRQGYYEYTVKFDR